MRKLIARFMIYHTRGYTLLSFARTWATGFMLVTLFKFWTELTWVATWEFMVSASVFVGMVSVGLGWIDLRKGHIAQEYANQSVPFDPPLEQILRQLSRIEADVSRLGKPLERAQGGEGFRLVKGR